jgi:signal peptidase II
MRKFKLKINFGKVSLILLGVLAVLLAADLVTKYLEELYGWNFTIIPNIVVIKSGVRNSGAAFSFLAQKEWGQAFLIIVTCIMLAFLIFAFIVMPDRFLLLKLAVTMLISGAIGNLIDRIAFNEVRDFIYTNMLFTGAYCNLADFWIVIGVIIAVIDLLFLNEYAVFPLTKKAKAAQEKYKQEKLESEKDNSSNDNNEGSNDK